MPAGSCPLTTLHQAEEPKQRDSSHQRAKRDENKLKSFNVQCRRGLALTKFAENVLEPLTALAPNITLSLGTGNANNCTTTHNGTYGPETEEKNYRNVPFQ